MRHKSKRLRLNEKPDHARHLLRNLATAVILYESIRTTRKRARIIQPVIDKLITTSKGKNISVAIRAINNHVNDVNASRKLMDVLSKRYSTRSSGFTRVKALGSRKGDGAELVELTLVDAEIAKKSTAADKAPKVAKAPKAAKKPAAKKADAPASTDSK